jgi:ABC transport system ATP-binding/permease protein
VVALLGDGRLRDLPGGVDQYLDLRRAASASADSSDSRGAGGGRESDGSAGEVRAARKELARLERQLEKLHERESRVYAEMAAAASDHERVLGLDAALRSLRDERAVMEDRWLELAERAD